ncbi:hypothetical protein Nepgr_026645 [Nepenthes gracilis]|uniref:Uncharacterized protein n=1 Tax=Nepenthes gracilis TaxID=150966 RepID=A0AAD3T8L4_NEPGR|nr:hypothetical protein Nepgr_026645 [Nepenthes gracilis]
MMPMLWLILLSGGGCVAAKMLRLAYKFNFGRHWGCASSRPVLDGDCWPGQLGWLVALDMVAVIGLARMGLQR